MLININTLKSIISNNIINKMIDGKILLLLLLLFLLLLLKIYLTFNNNIFLYL